MDQDEKLRLLKSLHLLDQIPEDKLAALGEFLKPVLLQAGALIFAEGTKGNSLYFVSSGQIRISKAVAGKISKDLALLGPGDCFGEMALIEEVARSASATAATPSVVFELGRADMNRWLKSHPELAMGFFSELVQLQSKRLRRTSSELALLFDLSSLLLDQTMTANALLTKVLEHVTPHLEGSWSAAAYVYNPFNEEMDFVSAQGDRKFNENSHRLEGPGPMKNVWIDKYTYHVFLPEDKRPLGYFIFHNAAGVANDGRGETGRTLTMVARLVTAALENINFRTDEILRARLKASQPHDARL